jgi:hypothetical protein
MNMKAIRVIVPAGRFSFAWLQDIAAVSAFENFLILSVAPECEVTKDVLQVGPF